MRLEFVRMIAQGNKGGDTHCLGAARPILLRNGRNSKEELLNRYRGKDQNFGGVFSSYCTSPNLVSRSLLPHIFSPSESARFQVTNVEIIFIILGPITCYIRILSRKYQHGVT